MKLERCEVDGLTVCSSCGEEFPLECAVIEENLVRGRYEYYCPSCEWDCKDNIAND